MNEMNNSVFHFSKTVEEDFITKELGLDETPVISCSRGMTVEALFWTWGVVLTLFLFIFVFQWLGSGLVEWF